MDILIEKLTQDSFTPYGILIQQPNRPADAKGDGWSWWAENTFLPNVQKPYGIGYLDLRPDKLSFDWAERHMHSQEMIIPTGGDCLIYVAPAEYPEEPAHMPQQGKFRVFRVKVGEAVILREGVWHGEPLAVNQPVKALVLLLKNTGKEDVYINRFEDQPVRIING